MYEYLVSRQNSPELFKSACNIISDEFPNAKKQKLLVDVDGSTIQTFTLNGKDIDVFDAYDYGTVFIKSEIDLGEWFKNAVKNEGFEMVKIKKLQENNEYVSYQYFPEGKMDNNVAGEIRYNKRTGERRLLKRAKDSLSNYWAHAFSICDRFRENGIFEDVGSECWW